MRPASPGSAPIHAPTSSISISVRPEAGASPFRSGPRDLHPTGLPRAKSWRTAAPSKGAARPGRRRSVPRGSRCCRTQSPRRRAPCRRWCPGSTPSAGSSSHWRWPESPSPSTPGSMTGSGGGDDHRPHRPLAAGAALAGPRRRHHSLHPRRAAQRRNHRPRRRAPATDRKDQ